MGTAGASKAEGKREWGRTLLDAGLLRFVDDELLQFGFVFVGELGDVELRGLEAGA